MKKVEGCVCIDAQKKFVLRNKNLELIIRARDTHGRVCSFTYIPGTESENARCQSKLMGFIMSVVRETFIFIILLPDAVQEKVVCVRLHIRFYWNLSENYARMPKWMTQAPFFSLGHNGEIYG
jgi:hypothetical protein